jgi:hypothetical protein
MSWSISCCNQSNNEAAGKTERRHPLLADASNPTEGRGRLRRVLRGKIGDRLWNG